MPLKVRLKVGRIVEGCKASRLQETLAEEEEKGYKLIALYCGHPNDCVDVDQLVRNMEEESLGLGEFSLPNIIDKQLPQIPEPDFAIPVPVPPGDWRNQVVGRISSWIDPDSDNPYVRLLSQKALLNELDYFSCLALPAVLIPLRRLNNANLGSIVSKYVTEHRFSPMEIWVDVPTACTPIPEPDAAQVPTSSDQQDAAVVPEVVAQAVGGNANHSTNTWEWFYQFRTSCDNPSKMRLVLNVTGDVPINELKRWKGESLVAFKLNTRAFWSDSSTCPVLSKGHNDLVKRLFSFNLKCLIEGPTLHVRRQSKNSPANQSASSCLYVSCLEKLWKARYRIPFLQWVAYGSRDKIYLPLQPLVEYLADEDYAIFEADKSKYQQYRLAFKAALDSITFRSDNPSPMNIVVMVLGAGRGPLVQVCYELLKKYKKEFNWQFKLYAVERNPSALMTLNSKCAADWNNEVEVVLSDMRDFHPDQKADVVVSELLGSFGDNELSPECLDGALHLMKEDCISIPTSYRSFVSPIHSPSLFDKVRAAAALDNPVATYEKLHGVGVVNYYAIAPVQELFKFDHPNWTRRSRDRYVELTFLAQEKSEIMGIAGYFHATLYGSVSLSTVPGHDAPGLGSWWLVLLPLQHLVVVEKDARIRVRFWRCSDTRRVWYEWQLVEPVTMQIMNKDGRSYSMDLHFGY